VVENTRYFFTTSQHDRTAGKCGELFRGKKQQETNRSHKGAKGAEKNGMWLFLFKEKRLNFIMTETGRISTALKGSFKTNMCCFSIRGEWKEGGHPLSKGSSCGRVASDQTCLDLYQNSSPKRNSSAGT
jgi:hypothetical protein